MAPSLLDLSVTLWEQVLRKRLPEADLFMKKQSQEGISRAEPETAVETEQNDISHN